MQQTIKDHNGNIVARNTIPNKKQTPIEIIEMMLAKVSNDEAKRYVIGKNDLVRAKILITQHQYKFLYTKNASGGYTVTNK